MVIVDEYQDVNPIQENLVRELYSLGASIRVVGDDDQTIFQFRGTDVSNILTFTDRYPDCETIRLEDNFRSSVGIADVARLVIEKNPSRLPKTMRSAELQVYESGDIVALQLGSPDAEAAYIADTCLALRGHHDQGGRQGATDFLVRHGGAGAHQSNGGHNPTGAASGGNPLRLGGHEHAIRRTRG